jgi:glycosyltransferase involved in cell wall biosynthesis
MKVLHVVNVYSDKDNRAAQPFVKAQIDSLINAGIDVDVLNVKGNESKLNYLGAIRKCRKSVKEGGYDIVHGHYVYSGLIAALQTRAISVVSFMGSDLYGTFTQNEKVTKQGHFDIHLSKCLQLMIDGIIVKTPEMLNLLIRPQKAIILPNGVDFNIFRKSSKEEAKQRLRLDPEKKYILFAGDYLSPRKGYSILEEAVNRLKQDHPEYELLMAHKVPHEFVPIYMNAAEVLGLPSLKEGSPNVVKEAIACNLPVVATDVGDIREIIGHIPGCFLVKRNSKRFADALHRAAEQNSDFRGRECIDHLRIERIAHQLQGFYTHLIKSKGSRRGIQPCSV